MSTNSPPPAKPAVPEAPPATPVSPASKPVETAPMSLDDAIAAQSSATQAPEPVDADKTITDLHERFDGDTPADYAQKQLTADARLVDLKKMREDAEYGKTMTEVFLRKVGKMGPLRDKIVAQLEKSGQRNIDRFSPQVEELMMKDAELETTQYWQVENVKAIGEMTLDQAGGYMFYKRILDKVPAGKAIQYPEDNIFDSRTRGFSKDAWNDPRQRKELVRLSQTNREDIKHYVAEMTLKENWGKLPPDKQREILQSAADKHLDRLAQLGQRLLEDRQPVGVICLTVAGYDKFTPARLQLIDTLPDDLKTDFLRKLGEIRGMQRDQTISLTLADGSSMTINHTATVDKNMQIKGVYTDPPDMRKTPVRFNKHTEGDANSVVQQMMGIAPMKEEPRRMF